MEDISSRKHDLELNYGHNNMMASQKENIIQSINGLYRSEQLTTDDIPGNSDKEAELLKEIQNQEMGPTESDKKEQKKDNKQPMIKEAGVWEKRLAFTVTILGWGAVLVGLWPVASSFQIGAHFSLLQSYEIGDLRPELGVFYLILGFVALGFTVLTLAFISFMCRGIWLAFPTTSDNSNTKDDDSFNAEGAKKFLLNLSQNCYISIFTVSAVAVGFWVPLSLYVLLILFFQLLLVENLSLNPDIAYYITIIIFSILVFIIFIILVLKTKISIKLLKIYERLSKKWETRFSLSFLIFLIVLILMFQNTYTVELEVNERIYNQNEGEKIEIYVRLGGVTSAPDLASLQLLDQEGETIMSPELYNMDGGLYLAILNSSILSPGQYEVVLKYHHWNMGLYFPPYQSSIKRTHQFIIIS